MARPCSGGIVVASPTERLIIETLSRLVPAAAVSYEQCLLDLSQGQRRSYRGAEPAPPPVWFQKKRTPALGGPGSFAGWGEGLGAGGTPIRHYPGQRGDGEAVPAMRARAGALDTGVLTRQVKNPHFRPLKEPGPESLIFILIGLSLRGVLLRLAGAGIRSQAYCRQWEQSLPLLSWRVSSGSSLRPTSLAH
jgi:hypothetical protein